ncbi:MAG: acetylornithine/succinylornithine family transaminase [Clostridium sp.]
MFNKEDISMMNTYADLSINLVSGDGCYLFDDNNNKYLDFTSGIGVNSIGYNNKKWALAVSKQASTLPHISNLFFNETTLNLCTRVTDLSNMSSIFLANSGAEANEGAIKLARKYSFDKYGTNRNVILTLKQSFHGRTLAALAATGQDKFHNYFFPFPKGFDYVEANNINDFKNKIGNDVCAIMLEAIQGEGGVNVLDSSFVKEVVKICNEKDILVIFDEVQCGIGRTGKLFGFNHFDVNPDIITVAKGLGGGLPIGGFICNEKLSTVLKPGDHGTTFGGNPIVCAGALVVIDEICNQETFDDITNKGILIKEFFEKLNSPLIKEVRGCGLMIGIETTVDPSLIQKKAIEKGILVLTAGKNAVRLLPPLTISTEEILFGLNIIKEILDTI